MIGVILGLVIYISATAFMTVAILSALVVFVVYGSTCIATAFSVLPSRYGRSYSGLDPQQHQRTRTNAASTLPLSEGKHVEKVLFIECGFGSDAHGQNSTKAAVRACRNAIEFNQIPSISQIVPGGRENMKLDVLLAVPALYQPGLDLDAVRRCFPYGQVRIQLQDGGMIASNGKVIAEMGDTNEDMVIVCVAVTVGY